MAAALGITEKELIKVGISENREEFMNYLLSKIPEGKRDDFLVSFEIFENNLTIMDSLGSKKISDLSQDDKLNLRNSYETLTLFSLSLFYSSIITDKRKFTPDVQKEYEYRHNLLKSILDDRFKNELSTDDYYKLKSFILENDDSLTILLGALNYVARSSSDKFTDEEKQQLLDNIKENYLFEEYEKTAEFERDLIAKKYDFRDPKQKEKIQVFNYLDAKSILLSSFSYDLSENIYRRMIIKENHDDFKVWDKAFIEDNVRKVYVKWLKEYQKKKSEKEKNNNASGNTNQNGNNTIETKEALICALSKQVTEEEINDVESKMKDPLIDKTKEV